MKFVSSDQRGFTISANREPVLHVRPGEVVQMQTSSEASEALLEAGENWEDIFDIDALLQVTGPVYIEGVESGDGVAVEILAVEPLDWGLNLYMPGFSLVASRLQHGFLRRIPIVDGWVHLSDRIKVPVQPNIGCLGLAPPQGELRPFLAYPWGGNYDLVQMKPGNTAIFPAQVPGGLFYVSDLHAAMGAAEPSYVAIECAGTITVRFDIRKQTAPVNPRVESTDRLHILGLAEGGAQDGNKWDVSRRQACELMFDYLTRERRLSPEDAFAVFSASVDLTYGGPAGVSVASIPLDIFN